MRDPFSLEAEQSVLGAMMIAPEMIDLLCADISAKDFYWQDNADVFKAILEMNSLNRHIDFLTVGEHIGNLDSGEPAFAYTAEIQKGTPSTANAEQYARIVRERSMDRALIEAAREIHEIAHSTIQTEDKISRSQTAILGLDTETATNDTVNIFDSLVKHMDVLEVRLAGDNAVTGIATGHEDFDNHTGGLQPGGLYLVAGRPKMGKEQPNSCKVRVPGGWKAIGEMSVGDEIFSPDGHPSMVLGVYPQGMKEVFKLTFSDGRTARCGIEHLWEVRHKAWAKQKVMSTSELKVLVDRNRARYSIRMVSGDFEGEKALPIDPWLTGFLLGDGGLTCSVRFSSNDAEIVDRVKTTLGADYQYNHYGKYDYQITTQRGKTSPILNELRFLGMYGVKSESKRIPDQYMTASKEQRMELLRGLIDADGWVEKKGSVLIGVSSEALADDIRALVFSLGGKCTKRLKKTTHLDSHVLTVNLGPGKVPMWLPRKVDRLKGGRGDALWLTINSIASEGVMEECTCIKVSHPDELYVTDDYIVTHNTTFALGICQHAAIRQGKRVMMYHLEMTEKQVMDKVLAAESTIPLDAMKDGSALSDHSAQLMAAVSKMKDAHFDASYRSSYTMQQIRADARRKKRKDGLDLIMVDHLGLLNGDDPKHNQVAKITEISRQAKLMAKELNVPVLFLSQLNRSLEQRPNKRPVPSDLRDSGSLEQDADMIIFVYRDEVYHPDTDRKGIAEIIIGAARECSPETFFSIFQGKYSRFTKLDPAVFQGWDEEEPAPKSSGGTKWKKEGF
jgi:replicative DNA helicase